MAKAHRHKEQDNNNQLLSLSISPHIHSNLSVKKIMWDVIIALVPALGMGIYFFGTQVLYPVAISIFTALITEAIISKIRGRKTISNGSGIVTGLLLAMIMPPGVPLWLPAVGAACAVILGKEVFGDYWGVGDCFGVWDLGFC